MKRKFLCFICAFLLLMPVVAIADDFADYSVVAGGEDADLTIMPIEGSSYNTVFDFFPPGTPVHSELGSMEGRIICVTGNNIYLQRTLPSTLWSNPSANYPPSNSPKYILVATRSSSSYMDPAFVRVSPDGTKIAIGAGYGQSIYIVPTSILSASSPPDIATDPNVTIYGNAHYDGEWYDNTYFAIDGGTWPDASSNGIVIIDTSTGTNRVVISNKPGASSGVTFDSNGNLYCAIGYLSSPPNRTGEIKGFSYSSWWNAWQNSTQLDYETDGVLVANNILSGGYLGFDDQGNMHVGGGDAFGSGGATEVGYAAIIHSDVFNNPSRPDIWNGGSPVDESNPAEYKQLQPDPNKDDTSTGVNFNPYTRCMVVFWNPSDNNPGAYPNTDNWQSGVYPALAIYVAGASTSTTEDRDGDGVPDQLDNCHLTANAGQQDTDGDDFGNMCDCDLDNSFNAVNYADFVIFRAAWLSTPSSSNWNPDADFNSDSVVNYSDFVIFKTRWLTGPPWY